MPPNDPFLPLRNWRSTLFRGDKPIIDRFIQQLDVKLPAGWSRDSDYERARQRPDHLRCYLFDRPGDASVRVWLQLVTPTRVRAGSVQLPARPRNLAAFRQLLQRASERRAIRAFEAEGARNLAGADLSLLAGNEGQDTLTTDASDVVNESFVLPQTLLDKLDGV